MTESTRFVAALNASGIKRIAVVDDAFDLPTRAEASWGPVRDHLIAEQFIQKMEGLGQAGNRLAAVNAIEESDFESDTLTDFMAELFKLFVDSGEAIFDPDSHFFRERDAPLKSIRAILRLLTQGDGVTVTKIGSDQAGDFTENSSDIDLIFADYFLDPSVTANEGLDTALSSDARINSQKMIEAIITTRGKTAPSIVLMSSKAVAGRATEYRQSLGSKSYAARFTFIEKNHLFVDEHGIVKIEEPASDALLDILQTFKFGEGLSVALELWQGSAKKAIQATIDAAAELEIRDFAYLIRFRLEKEGQELTEYLEWLLGEYLIDRTARTFYAGVQADPESVRDVASTQATIEGAFDGQSQAVANIYHHVRIEDPRPGRTLGLRTGDLFLSSDMQRISALITPDCDLVLRDDKRRAKRLMFVHGRVQPFDRKHTSAAEFIMIDKTAKNIVWSKKDIETHDFAWVEDTQNRKYIGTLRPTYALQLQHVVLQDLGRIGLAPGPALWVEANVELFFHDDEGRQKRITIPPAISQKCAVMPARPDANGETHMTIFPRTLMRKVRELLSSLDQDKVVEHGRIHIAALADSDADVALALACRGVALESLVAHGLWVTKENAPDKSVWCWLAVRVS